MLSIIRRIQWMSPAISTLVAIACVAQEPGNLDYEVPTSGLISAIETPQLASGKAGLLVFTTKRGEVVAEGENIAQLEAKEADLTYRAQMETYKVAKQQASNDVDVRYAKAQAGVTKYDLQTAIDANNKSPGAVALSQVKSLEFQNQRSELAIEQAVQEHAIAQMTERREGYNLLIAKQELEGRIIKAPFTGVVVQEIRQNGEWVTPGDPVVKFIRLDKLQVEGRVDVDEWAPTEAKGRPVTVILQVGRNREERIETTISYVSAEISSNRTYAIAAEFVNPEVGGEFLIRPGMQGRMVIHFGRQAIGTARADEESPPLQFRP